MGAALRPPGARAGGEGRARGGGGARLRLARRSRASRVATGRVARNNATRKLDTALSATRRRLARADGCPRQPWLTRADIGKPRSGGLPTSQLPESSPVVPHRPGWHGPRLSRGTWPLPSHRAPPRAPTNAIAPRRRRCTRRTSSDPRLNPQLHLVALDGAGHEQGGELCWQGLSDLQTSEGITAAVVGASRCSDGGRATLEDATWSGGVRSWWPYAAPWAWARLARSSSREMPPSAL